MKKNAVLQAVFGAIVLLGGVMGYIKAGSLSSLWMSSVFAVILWFGSFFCYKDKLSGLYIGTFSTALLFFFFLYRFVSTMKVMPAGLMIVLSGIFAVPLIIQLTKKMKESPYG